jgi:hypothetical protein
MIRHILIAALLVCVPTLGLTAEHKPGECYQKTITVCVPKKKKVIKAPEVVVTPTPETVIVAPAPEPVVVERTVIKTVPGPTKVVEKPCTRPHVTECEAKDSDPRFGIYGAAGVGVRDQYYSVNLGIQVRVPKAHLGFRIFSAIDRGIGAQGLIYVYQGKRVLVHVVDPGIQATGTVFSYNNNTDVPRSLDMILGAGVQVKLKCDLALLIDWRVNLADPVYLAQNNGVLVSTGPNSARYLDAPHVVGNSFSSSQLMLGLLWDLPVGKGR